MPYSHLWLAEPRHVGIYLSKLNLFLTFCFVLINYFVIILVMFRFFYVIRIETAEQLTVGILKQVLRPLSQLVRHVLGGLSTLQHRKRLQRQRARLPGC